MDTILELMMESAQRMETIQGFMLGMVAAALLLSFGAVFVAFTAIARMWAFEKRTHQIEWVPVNADGAREEARRKIETGDEDLDEALADAEEKELDGISAIHHRPGPLL